MVGFNYYIPVYTGVHPCILHIYLCIPVYTGIDLHMYTGVYTFCVYLYTGVHARYLGNTVLNHATYGCSSMLAFRGLDSSGSNLNGSFLL